MEGEPVRQTRRGVEPRPPAKQKQKTEANQQQNWRQSKRRVDHFEDLGNFNGVPARNESWGTLRGARYGRATRRSLYL